VGAADIVAEEVLGVEAVVDVDGEEVLAPLAGQVGAAPAPFGASLRGGGASQTGATGAVVLSPCPASFVVDREGGRWTM